jgi:hypothetical protein
VSVGDAITPDAEEHTYPVLVGMAAPKLRMYPVETVVAEKVEAAVKLGMINSRMKDFYDLLVIFRRFPYDEGTLARAIAETFARRGTPLPQTVPPGLSDDFGDDPTANRLLRGFLTRMQLVNEPTDFAAVVRTVRDRFSRIRYVLPRHKAANWVGRGRGRKSTRPGANGVVELTPPRVPRPARRSRPAAAEAPAPLSRGVCAESQAEAGRHGAGHWEHW